MSVVTKTGDFGTTSIIGRTNLSKGDLRFEVLGGVDELSSYIGLALLKLPAPHQKALHAIQQDLFRVGAEVGSVGGRGLSLMLIGPGDIARLEAAVTHLEQEMPPLEGLVLPGGGNVVSATLDLARAVCRRVERATVRFLAREDPPPEDLSIQIYLNRLSDYLFVLARCCDTDRVYARTQKSP